MLVAVKSLGEATVRAVVVETAGEAVARHDVGEVGIGQPVDVTDTVSRLTPYLFGAMVAMLQNESPVVDGFVYLVASAVPVGEVRHIAGDVSETVGAEVIHHGVGVFIRRPLIPGIALVNGVDADGLFAKFVFPKAVDDFGT